MPVSLNEIVAALPDDDSWGPSTPAESLLDGVPYAPYSKGDKLGRMADWTAEKEREGRTRQNYGRGFRDQQVYGAGTTSLFAVQLAEDESTFSVVDNTKATKTRGGFGRGGGTVFRGRGQRGGPAARARGTFQRVGRGRDDFRGRGRGGRRFGWRDYDKPQRNRDASVNIKADWKMLEEIDFNRLAKLNLETDDGEDLESYGFLWHYDRSYDKQPIKSVERRLNVIDRAAYNVTTSSDPVIQELAEKDEATIFATDSILSMIMCAPRSIYPWDIVILHQGNKLYLDKRDDSSIDHVPVNENAIDPPLEVSEGNRDIINSPSALSLEATFINHNFANQVVIESQDQRVEMTHENPFYNAMEETEPLASKAYRYRRFDLSLNNEEPVQLVVRTEVDAVMKNPVNGEDMFLSIKALNEFDHRALDWRTKLATQRGAVVATEMKNNSCKLARWTAQAILAGASLMKIGFVSRINPKLTDRHAILGVVGYKPREFANQMNLNLNNGWGIVRTIVDMCLAMPEGKYVLVKDPNKPVLRLYEVPLNTFEDEGLEREEIDDDEADDM